MIERDEDWIMLEEIANIKWRNGFQCGCGCTVTIKAKKELNKRCAQCKTEHSPTAGTLFDRLRMPVSFAMHIIKEVVEGESRPQSVETSDRITEFGRNSIRQKTVWDFMLKVYSSIPVEPYIFDDGLFIRYRIGEIPIILCIGHVGKALRYYAEILPDESDTAFVNIIHALTASTAFIKAYEFVRTEHSFARNKIEVQGRKSTNKLAIDAEPTLRYLDSWFKHVKTSSKKGENVAAYLNAFIYRSNGNKYENLLEHVIIH